MEVPGRQVGGRGGGGGGGVVYVVSDYALQNGTNMPTLLSEDEALLTMPTRVYRMGGMLHALTLM